MNKANISLRNDPAAGYNNVTAGPITEAQYNATMKELAEGVVALEPEIINSFISTITFTKNKTLPLDDRHIQSANITASFDLTGAVALTVVSQAVQGNGGTFTLTGSNFVFMTNSAVANGGVLTNDTTYIFSAFYDGSTVFVTLAETGAAAIDVIAPTVSSAVVENATPNQMSVVFSEAVTIDDLVGLSLNFTTGTAKTISAIASGSGTNTFVFTLSGNVAETDVFNFVFAVNNTIKDQAATPNSLAAGSIAVTNNVVSAAWTSFNGTSTYVKFGDILGSLFAATTGTKLFALEIEVRNFGMTGSKHLTMKSHGGSFNRTFFWFISNGEINFFYYGTGNANGQNRGFKTPAVANNSAKTLRIEYTRGVDTNNGADRVDILVDGVSQTLTQVQTYGALPFDIFNGTAQLSFGTAEVDNAGTPSTPTFDGDARSFKVQSWNGSAWVDEINVPTLSTGTDQSGNGRNGTFTA